VSPGVDFLTATTHDTVTCRDIFFASYNDLHRRYGQQEEDPTDPGWLDDALSHLLRTDPGGTVLALEDGAPCGFAASYRRDTYWFLSFLFVLPEVQGRGVGRDLLEAVLPSDELTRALVVESFQPASTGLYAAYGITPRSVRYMVSGPSHLERLPGMPSDLRAEPMSEADGTAIAELDRRHLGYARPQDHAWWHAGSKGWVYRRGDEVVGYGYRDEEGVAPALGRDEATLCAIVADLLRRSEDPAKEQVPVRGETAALFGMLVRAGGRIAPSGYRYLYCSSAGPLPATYSDYAGYMP
jgi:GNAT superfamily N-acetyltransferase